MGGSPSRARAHARGMLVEAAWAASKTPGPLRAFYQRVRARRGMQVAVVATVCKLAVHGRERTLDVMVVEEYHEDVLVKPPTCPTCGQPASQSLAGPEHD